MGMIQSLAFSLSISRGLRSPGLFGERRDMLSTLPRENKEKEIRYKIQIQVAWEPLPYAMINATL